MALGLRIIREIVQALLRVWNKKDEGNILENAAQTSTASGDGSNGKPALAATGPDPVSQLRSGGRGHSGRNMRRSRRGLVVAQVALAVMQTLSPRLEPVRMAE